MGREPLMSRGLLIFEALRSCSDTPHSVGLLWMGDRHDAETSVWQHTFSRGRHPCARRDLKAQPQHANGRRPRGHWDRPVSIVHILNVNCCVQHSASAFGQQLSVTIRYTRPVGLLSTSDQLVAGFTGLDNTQQIQQTNIQCPQWISSPRSQQSTGHRSAP